MAGGKTPKTTWPRSLAALVITGALASAILLNATSNLLQMRAPERAANLNPLNVEARINGLVQALNNPKRKKPSAQMAQQALKVIGLAPLDPRGYSLLGEISVQNQQTTRADQLFTHALALSGTEIHALRWKMNQAMTRSEFPKAVKKLHLLTLRWPDKWPEVLPVLVQALNDKTGLEQAGDLFSAPNRQRRLMFTNLRTSPEGAAAAADLLLLLFEKNSPALGREIDRTLARLLDFGLTDQATTLLLFTLSNQEQAQAGFVYNSQFTLPPSKGPFDWTIKSLAGVEISRTTVTPSGLRIEFLDAPVRMDTPSQTVLLYESRYKLTLRIETSELATPDPVFLELRCNGQSSEQLAAIEIPQGSYGVKDFEAEFEVGGAACPKQLLQFTNRTKTLKWANRSNGTLIIRQVLIELAGQN